ncbi:phosphoribosylaminoimidazolesuccinocarboxamide synthase [Tindallia californiensis]|uniref:Phosphoribosylaminoimidazole-succinocarboxamide synthase n=1 Tax=Tindallia californiensis TaxID=159292 RepID=A0A1H3L6B3_9FIRM|nr:phosphoribosylaminoimidazolesuccinocarboxamide synthase [Tindallia californiensis]SDY59739.1 phosphoribosylaminoimidazole-succinocarboxamide synthase [Tindallia californiensis]
MVKDKGIEKKEMLYEGKAKQVYVTEDASKVIVYFKDDATAFNGKKKSQIEGKGKVNNHLSSLIYTYLEGKGVKTHFIQRLSDREMLVKAVTIIPLEIIVRNVAAGSMTRQLGVKEGTVLKKPIVEYSLKKDELGDPFVNEDHIIALEWATEEELNKIRSEALTINKLLIELFSKAGLKLIDFKLEFGVNKDGVLLADEISPDTCRLWETRTGRVMDKDRFRKDMGQVSEHYEEVLERVSKVLAV